MSTVWSGFARRAAARVVVVMALAGTNAAALAADFYVSPDGTADGDGSRERPWDLATALAHPAAVQPGDTIWLEEGTYRGAFTSRLNGEPDRPILVRPLPAVWPRQSAVWPGPGEACPGDSERRGQPCGQTPPPTGARATLDATGVENAATTLAIHGSHTWFWGLEITNSNPRRVTETTGSSPADLGRAGSVDVYEGEGTRLINLIVHDCAAGPNAWSGATDTEIYGCLVYYNGWDAPDRGHGHAFYCQNERGTKRIADNIFFSQFSHGIHIYGSERATLDNFQVEGNIAFNNGALSQTSGFTRNLLIGGGRVANNITVRDNYTYFPTGGGNILGYGQGCAGLVAEGNYFAHPGGTALSLNAASGAGFSPVRVAGNTFIGGIDGFTAEQFPDNTYAADNTSLGGADIPVCPSPQPSGTGVSPVSGRAGQSLPALHVAVRRNHYEPGRAHIVIYNWDRRDAVAVDLSPAGLAEGDRYEIRDAQNYFGEPVFTGTYDAAPITIPMTRLAVADPVGDVPVQPEHTGPEFGAFVLLRVADED